jgi:hypothetical protein
MFIEKSKRKTFSVINMEVKLYIPENTYKPKYKED